MFDKKKNEVISETCLKKMKINGTAIICLLARNVEKQLINNIPKIDLLRKYFDKSWVIVVENNSVDNTKEILNSWQSRSSGIYIDTFILNLNSSKLTEKGSIFPGASSQRIERMVFIRNRYINFMKLNNMHSDYVIVIDIDLDDFDEKKIVKAIKNAPENWSSIFANGRLYSTILNKIAFTKYYDTYAYVPFNSKTIQLTYREQFLNRDLMLRKYTPCKSAFGGIGIYKYDSIINSEYKTINNERCSLQEVICEHILFNTTALNSGANYICRDLKTYYQKCSVWTTVIPSNIFIKILIRKHKIHKEMTPAIIALSANSKQQTANSKQQTANSKQQTANSKQQTANDYVARIRFVKYQFVKTEEIRRCA